MIAETSGSCIAVFTGDSIFLYLVVEWPVKCYKFCLSSHSLGSQVPRSQVLILDYALNKYIYIYIYI